MNAFLTDIYGFLVNQSVHLAILFFLIWVMVVFFRKQSAHLRYLLWLVILVKCLVPPMVTIPMAVLPEKTVSVEQQDTAREILPDMPAFFPEPTNTSGKFPDKMASASPAGPTASVHAAESSDGPVLSAPVEKKVEAVSPQQWTVVAWAAGFTLFIGVTLMRGLRFEVLLHRRRLPCDESLQKQIDAIANTFWPGLRMRVYQLEGISQPFVWGLLRGAVYLPANFTQTGTDTVYFDVIQEKK